MPILWGLSYCSIRVIHSIRWDLVLGLAFWICLIHKTACNEHIFSFYRWNPWNREIRKLYNSEVKSRLKFFLLPKLYSLPIYHSTLLFAYISVCFTGNWTLKIQEIYLIHHQGVSTWYTIWHSTNVLWVNEWAHELFDSLYKILLFY